MVYKETVQLITKIVSKTNWKCLVLLKFQIFFTVFFPASLFRLKYFNCLEYLGVTPVIISTDLCSMVVPIW